MPRKSITFTDAHSEWLKAQVASGQYRSESEVISDLIRERKSRNTGIGSDSSCLDRGRKKRIKPADAGRYQEGSAGAIKERWLVTNSVIRLDPIYIDCTSSESGTFGLRQADSYFDGIINRFQD